MSLRPQRLSLLVGAALFGAAALFWLLFLPRAEESVFGRVPYLDEVIYLDRAADIRDGRAAGEPHFMAPLYPHLVAAAAARPMPF